MILVTNNSEILVSVIIPVYNVEDYIERCIRSLEDQNLAKDCYEIIVVNDGSPDNSRDVVLKLMNEFDNIIFIEQQNKGVSLARNAGIQKATGQYLLFIDPDDLIIPQTLGVVVSKAMQHDAEVVFLGYYLLDVHGTKAAEILHTEYNGNVYSGLDAYRLSRGDGKVDPDRSWAILFRRNFIVEHQLLYLSQIPYLEDGEFIARVLCMTQRCIFAGLPFYLRTTRPGSATNSPLFYSDKAINGFMIAAKNLKLFQSQECLTENQRIFLNQPICKFIMLVLIPLCHFKKFNEFKRWVAILKSQGLGRCELNMCHISYKIEGKLYNVSPNLFYLHRILRMPLFKVFGI